MTYIFEGMRRSSAAAPCPCPTCAISFGLNILYLTLSILFFGWMFERSRDRGLGRLD